MFVLDLYVKYKRVGSFREFVEKSRFDILVAILPGGIEAHESRQGAEGN